MSRMDSFSVSPLIGINSRVFVKHVLQPTIEGARYYLEEATQQTNALIVSILKWIATFMDES
jgi:hypothetical protein